MKTTLEILNSKPIESLTNFLSDIVGKPLVDGAGILYADAIRAKRIANSLKLEQKFNLKKSNDLKPTSLSFGYKLLEKASLEDNENILDKWTNLLSNATDKNFTNPLRKIFIDILEKLEPIDVKTFDEINQIYLSQQNKYEAQVGFNELNSFKLETLNVLLSLGLITYGVTVNNAIRVGGMSPTTFHGFNRFKVTELGQNFYKAVSRES